MENRRGWLGRGGAVIQFPPLPTRLFPSPARKADRQFSFPVVHSPAQARSSAATFPGISHRKWSGPTQCRRWCSWHDYSDGLLFVQSYNNPLLRALSGPAGGSAGQTQLVPAGLGEMRTSGWALQLRITRVCSPSRYCEAVVLRVCPPLTYDGS